jgi:hypothetical protein
VRNVELIATVRNLQMLSVAQKLLLWQVHVAGNTVLRSHEKCRMFLSNFNKISSSLTDVIDAINIKFHGNLSSENRAGTCGQTAFGDNAHAPKNVTYSIEVCSLGST